MNPYIGITLMALMIVFLIKFIDAVMGDGTKKKRKKKENKKRKGE